MPWDDSELWQVTLDIDGRPGIPERVAGGPHQSVFQPEWSPDGVLHFVSDATGWWNLYRLEEDGPRNLCPKAAEFGLPQWDVTNAVSSLLTQTTLPSEKVEHK